MSDFKYVQNHYKVPACAGRLVTVNGRSGIIIKDCGHHIGVNFDDDKPGSVSHCHPTWRVEYLGMGKPRKVTRAALRYQRFREYGDMFDSFIDYCRWDAEPGRSWNSGR